jgi:hypothetical protein
MRLPIYQVDPSLFFTDIPFRYQYDTLTDRQGGVGT